MRATLVASTKLADHMIRRDEDGGSKNLSKCSSGFDMALIVEHLNCERGARVNGHLRNHGMAPECAGIRMYLLERVVGRRSDSDGTYRIARCGRSRKRIPPRA